MSGRRARQVRANKDRHYRAWKRHMGKDLSDKAERKRRSRFYRKQLRLWQAAEEKGARAARRARK